MFKYLKEFTKSDLTYADVAHELGVCELTARNKINGKAKITKAEQMLLDNLFKGESEQCTILKHNR